MMIYYRRSFRHVRAVARRALGAAAIGVAASAPSARAQCPVAVAGTDTTLQRSQSDSSAPQRDAAAPTATTSPAIVLYAAASAAEVRFNAQPQLRVRLCGGLDSIHVLERRNLPSPVVVNTTYRDVYVAVEIFGRLNADCITSALLGGRRAADSGARAGTVGPDCASVEVRGTTARPPSDTGAQSPRR